MSARVTQESDADLWAKLMALWEAERRPGWVMNGKTQYMVLQGTNGLREFQEQGVQSLYETVSFK